MDQLGPTQKMDLFGPKMTEKWPFLAQKCRFKAILKFPTQIKGSKWAQKKKSQEPKIARNCINYFQCDFQPSP